MAVGIGYVVRKYFLAFGLTLVTGMASAEENASNPLAAVNNVDIKWQFTSADPGDKHDVFIDGAYMLMPELKMISDLTIMPRFSRGLGDTVGNGN